MNSCSALAAGVSRLLHSYPTCACERCACQRRHRARHGPVGVSAHTGFPVLVKVTRTSINDHSDVCDIFLRRRARSLVLFSGKVFRAISHLLFAHFPPRG